MIPPLDEAAKKQLLAYARAVIMSRFNGDKVPPPEGATGFAAACGAFVSLHRKGALRGCIGRMTASEPLVNTIADMACSAAFSDPRFPPLRSEEMPDLEIEITVLSPMKHIADASEIEVGTHGVYLSVAGRSAVFLPQVATEQGWSRDELLDNLAMKAGLPDSYWRRPDASLSIFEGLIFGNAIAN